MVAAWSPEGGVRRPTGRFAVALAGASMLVIALTVGAPFAGAENDGAAGSARLTRVGHLEIPGAMSVVFSSKKPRAYVQTRLIENQALVVVDIKDPRNPKKLGHIGNLPNVASEDLNLAERDDGTAFALVGSSGREEGLKVVDVSTDQPKLIASLDQGSHTWTCLGRHCLHAYATAGPKAASEDQLPTELQHFSIVDLAKPKSPRVAAHHPSPVVGSTVTHDWNYDSSGVMWAVGRNGIAAFDTTDPVDPRLLNLSDFHGHEGFPQYNDRLHLHGSLRPNATSFQPTISPKLASVHEGNVLLVSEEGPSQDCTDSFQTWYIPDLGGMPSGAAPNSGSITPLDYWNLLEHAVPGETRSANLDEWCMVHWFDYHQSGYVVTGAYGAGTHVLDVNNPHDIQQVGYYFEPGYVPFEGKWVPERGPNGRVTGRATTLIYTPNIGSITQSELQTVGGDPPTTGGIDILEFQPPPE